MGSNKSKIRGRVGFINQPSYKRFIKQYPKSEVTYEQYIAILKESTKSIKDFVLTNQLGFKLPLNLGYIAVHKFTPKKPRMSVDWPATLRLGRRIPLLNLHSFGFVYMINFYPNTKLIPLRGYDMKPHRLINRALAQNIKQNKMQYLSIERGYFNKRFAIEKYLQR